MAAAEAAAIPQAFVVPPGGQRLPKAPDVLRVPSSTLVSTTLVDDVSFWRAPGQPRAVLAWEQAHLPRRFTPEDADFGPPSWDRTFSLSPVPGVLNARAAAHRLVHPAGPQGRRPELEGSLGHVPGRCQSGQHWQARGPR